MALVAYENSDSSEYEDDEGETAVVVNIPKKDEVVESTSSTTLNGHEDPAEDNLFNLLPQPSNKKNAVIEEDDEFLHKKETVTSIKPKAKITVPSLSDFKDVESTPISKPRAASNKKSGLLSMLPQPRHASLTTTMKSLVPNSVAKKSSTETVKKKAPLPSPAKKSKSEPKSMLDYSDDSDDEVQTDFFSINKPDLPPVPIEELPLEEEVKPKTAPSQKLPRSIESYFKKDVVEDQMETEPDQMSAMEYSNADHYSNHAAESSTIGELPLDEEAIMKLVGARGKRKREDIQIVDVNQQEVLADAREWLLKGLMDDTTKRVSASKKKGNEPTSQQKRKHQITYLAHQAKANEAELQNQWANNRMTKRQTQSKYGF